MRGLSSHRAVSGHGYWSPLFREAEEAILRPFEALAIVVFLIFLWFYLDLLWGHGSLFGWLSFSCLFRQLSGTWAKSDLVAFASLSERFRFPKLVSQRGRLTLNDASGLVAQMYLWLLWTIERFLSAKLKLPSAFYPWWFLEWFCELHIVNRFCIAFTECASDRYSQWT